MKTENSIHDILKLEQAIATDFAAFYGCQRVKVMKIAIDMDNTLTDELGATLRPGITDFLETLSLKNQLFLWTNSKKARALEILKHHNLRKYFDTIISREDYDPEGKGIPKDLRRYDFDILIDDDPAEIQYNVKNKKTGILVESYRKSKVMDKDELSKIIKKYKL
ncbi:NIF family HAD-type phosphatase [Breznakiella homolactica]|uniref:DUF705 domain-containing protein n=1 Tax=Breznakiella homolactica TaxID=2798577 RepID=A0A7T7XK09_9SPIR|nr:NIF family HAD-type phosphatase [Breznakiella homolactica]QQO07786.1 HAD family hydrolase [Breznakiella homolactica]